MSELDPVRKVITERVRRRTCIKEWREYRGLTQEQLANRLEMTQSHLSMLENGKRGYTQETLEAVAETLQTDVGQLLTVNPITYSDLKVDFVPERKLQPTFIRAWRKHRGKTLEQLGETVEMSHAQLGRIERGLQPYSQSVLEAIADALDTDAASLLSRDPSDYEAIWSIWDKAQPSERELIVNVATAILKTRKGD